jgi:hypothetical protein
VFVLNAYVMHLVLPVTEPTNYTKLSKKIIHRVDDLANLSLYNPVVREITTDFKPIYISAKIVISLAVTITNYIKVHIADISEFKHSYYKPSPNKVVEAFSSNHTHSHRVRNKVPADDYLLQKHQTRRREWPLSMVLSFTHRRIKTVDTIAVIHLPICNKREQSPKYEKVLS